MTSQDKTQNPATEVLSSGPAPETPYVLASNMFGTYCIPETFSGREVPRLLRKGKVYERATLEFMRRQIKNGDVITGGAFVGDFFPALHEKLAPDACLHSFEPNPESFQAAAYTCHLNGLDKIRLHSCAVGAEDDVLPLAVGRGKQNASLGAGMRLVEKTKADGGRFQTIDVPVRRLDDLVPPSRNVDILHLDVEGFEIAALNGAQEILSQHPLVVLEGDSASDVSKFLEALEKLAPNGQYAHIGNIEKNSIFRAMAILEKVQ